VRAGTLAVLCLTVLAAGCGGRAGGSDDSTSAPTATMQSFPAPPLKLHAVDGSTVTLASLRGRPAVVTFVYSHCKNTCPVLLQALKLYRGDLGAKGRAVQVLAVSVDPAGDTPEAVRAFLKRRRLVGQVTYLLGSERQLERTWKAWHIRAGPDPKDPEGREHTAAIYGIDPTGQVRWVQVAEPLDPATLEANLGELTKT
jgi:protein SCO1/2